MQIICSYVVILLLGFVLPVTLRNTAITVCIQDNCSNSCTTLDCALADMQNGTTIKLPIGHYNISKNATFNRIEKFELIGDSDGNGSIVIECKENIGFSFIDSNNIRFESVTIQECGAPQIASSSNLNTSTASETHYVQVLFGLYFSLCSNITLNHVTVQKSPGIGVAFYSTGGTNVINSSHFLENGVRSDPGGGGVGVEFLYCLPGDLKCSQSNGSLIPANNRQNIAFKFYECTFRDNNAATAYSTKNAFVTSHLNIHSALGRGGGLAVILKGDARNVQITVESCEFSNNSAVWGGGAVFEFQDNATKDNSIVINSTTFVDNKCEYDPCQYEGTGGGGVRVTLGGSNGIGEHNQVKFQNSRFLRNKAYFGGGVSVSTTPEQSISNVIEFNDIVWQENVARLGSAIDLSVWSLFFDSTVLSVNIRDCTFQSNSVQYTPKVGTAIGTGTIFTEAVPINFMGFINCTNCKGSCIYSVEAPIRFADNTSGTFTNNTAHNGGAIALFSTSAYILLHDGVKLEFFDNKASLHGGAIYWEGIGNRYLVSARNCFIRYENIQLHPSDWSVNFTFGNNSALISGDDIFGTTLLSCLSLGNDSGILLDFTDSEFNQIFNWNSERWVYKTYTNNSIATAPSSFQKDDKMKCGSPFYLEVVPGNLSQLPVNMNDDRNILYPVNSLVFSAVINDSNDTAQYIASGQLPFTGREGEIKEYTIATLQPRVISSKVYLKLLNCPFGFKHDDYDEDCDGAKFPYVRTHTNFTSSIQRGYWIGSIDGEVLVSQCFLCPFNEKLPLSNFILLPSNSSETNTFFCDGFHRQGILCQDCKDGYALAISSDRFRCVKCSESDTRYGWLLYIVGKYVPVTIILLMVIIFNISVTSGYTNSFVVFAQLISTTFGPDSGQILSFSSITPAANYIRRLYTSLYGLWNLEFFESFNIIPYCFSKRVTILDSFLLSYAIAIYPLLILCIIVIVLALYDKGNRVVVCCIKPFHRMFARCLQFLNLRKRSIVDALATFIVLSYSKFITISAYLLYSNPLVDGNGTTVKSVTYFDYTKEFWSTDYAPYFGSGFLVMVVMFLLPVILLLYSIQSFQRFLQKSHFSFLLPGGKTKYFLNSFYHCFKDGTDGGRDQRFFASFYFFVRFILLYTYSLASTWAIQFLMQQVFLTIFIIVICVFQPYKQHRFNIIDAVMFGVLAVINAFTLYQLYLDVADIPLSKTCYYIQIVLIFLPLLYINIVIIYFLMNKYGKKNKTSLRKNKQNGHINVHSEGTESLIDDFSFGKFMDDVDAEDRFARMNYHGPLEDNNNNLVVSPNTPTAFIPSSTIGVSISNNDDNNGTASIFIDDMVVVKGKENPLVEIKDKSCMESKDTYTIK